MSARRVGEGSWIAEDYALNERMIMISPPGFYVWVPINEGHVLRYVIREDGELLATEMARHELRKVICQNAGVPIASERTWAMVVGMLGADEEMHPAMRAALPSDPFDGLPS